MTEAAAATFEWFAREHFLPYVENTLISHKEVETLLRLRILPALGHLPMRDITPGDVSRFRKQLISEGLSASRTNAHLATLRRAFSLAINWQLFQGRNPAASPGMLRTEGRETFLLEDQLRTLIAALEADPDVVAASAIMVLALTGARRSEILKARWDQVDLGRKVLTVPRSKSGRRRQIFLSDRAVEILRRQPMRPDEPMVFPSPRRRGQPLAGLRGAWGRARARAGLPASVRLHDLRHTFASLLVNEGVPLYEIGKLLGHTQDSTTARYAHLRDDRQLAAVNTVGRMAGAGGGWPAAAAPLASGSAGLKTGSTAMASGAPKCPGRHRCPALSGGLATTSAAGERSCLGRCLPTINEPRRQIDSSPGCEPAPRNRLG